MQTAILPKQKDIPLGGHSGGATSLPEGGNLPSEGPSLTGEQAKLASVLLSFSQEQDQSRKNTCRVLTGGDKPLAPLPASSPRGEEEEDSAMSLARLSPTPTSIRAYAKLQGKTWEYYVQKLATTLGRCPEPGAASADGGVDVFLGTSEGISRKHLRVEYNTADRLWELYCFGKTGVTVNGERYDPFCHPVPLASRTLIKVEDVEFYFLLPIDSNQHGPVARSATVPMESHSPPLLLNRPRNSRGTSRKGRKRSAESSTCNGVLRKKSSDITSTSGEGSGISDVDSPGVDPLPSGDLTKPSLSYACLIAEAISSTEEKRLTLSGIYQYLADKYPYFRYTKNGWQNSIRHNLSLNKAFRKVPRSMGEPGKGMFWVVDTSYKHLVEGSGPGRRVQRSRSMQPGMVSSSGQNSAPTSPQLRQNSLVVGMSNYVPILPTRPVSAAPAISQAFLSPQLLEAAAVVEMAPKLAMKRLELPGRVPEDEGN